LASQATKETVDLGSAHPPKEESINVFNDIEHEIKKELVKLRRDHNSEPPKAPPSGPSPEKLTRAQSTSPSTSRPWYVVLPCPPPPPPFASCPRQSDLSDDELVGFTSDNFEEVRVAKTAYGVILFGKLRIPAAPKDGPAYVHFRAFDGGPEKEHKFHSFYTEEKDDGSGGKTYRAIFTKNDKLDWFDS